MRRWWFLDRSHGGRNVCDPQVEKRNYSSSFFLSDEPIQGHILTSRPHQFLTLPLLPAPYKQNAPPSKTCTNSPTH
jgi:hypothetical protein